MDDLHSIYLDVVDVLVIFTMSKIVTNGLIINYKLFLLCSSLATVTFEKGSQLKTIGGGYSSYYPNYYGAFADCTALTSIEIPASVETIEAAAFCSCI